MPIGPPAGIRHPSQRLANVAPLADSMPTNGSSTHDAGVGHVPGDAAVGGVMGIRIATVSAWLLKKQG
jgi:hypothetical protein